MSDTNDVAELVPAARRAKLAPKKQTGRRSYADDYKDLERRVRLALAVLNNATAGDAMTRIPIATDILVGA